MNDAVADLNVIAPQPARVHVGGREIEVLPLQIKELSRFLAVSAPLLNENWDDFAGMLARQQDNVIAVLAVCGRVDAEWLGEQSAVDVLRLARVVMEVNGDFFVEALGPTIAVLASTMNRIGGPTLSSDSSAQGTTSTAS